MAMARANTTSGRGCMVGSLAVCVVCLAPPPPAGSLTLLQPRRAISDRAVSAQPPAGHGPGFVGAAAEEGEVGVGSR